MSHTPPTYLVGIDGSSQSDAALRWALNLAATTGAQVECIAVWSIPPSLLSSEFVSVPGVQIDVFEREAQELLDKAVAGIDAPNDLHQTVAQGHAGSVIADRSADADLVVVGRTGRGRLSRMLAGSTARFLARHASCPVALIGEEPFVADAVVVATDGSPHARGALRWAANLPTTKSLVLVHGHDQGLLSDMSLPDAVRSTLNAQAEELVSNEVLEAGLDPAGVATEVRYGDPRTTIIDATTSNELLVIGAAGHNPFVGAFLGSVCAYAIGHCAGSLVVWR